SGALLVGVDQVLQDDNGDRRAPDRASRFEVDGVRHLLTIAAAQVGEARHADRLEPPEHALAAEAGREHLLPFLGRDHRAQLAWSTAKRARMLSNSRRSDSYCDSNSSSGIPGALNIVNEYALFAPSATTRVGKRASSPSLGPAYMSITPVFASASIRKYNSPSPFTTLAVPSSYFSSCAKSVAHSGRFSIRDRYSNTSSLGALRTAVTVRLITAPSFSLIAD